MAKPHMIENIDITPEELGQIRSLPDFDLTMILSEIHDFGWPMGRKTLAMAVEAIAVRKPGRRALSSKFYVWARGEDGSQEQVCANSFATHEEADKVAVKLAQLRPELSFFVQTKGKKLEAGGYAMLPKDH